MKNNGNIVRGVDWSKKSINDRKFIKYFNQNNEEKFVQKKK